MGGSPPIPPPPPTPPAPEPAQPVEEAIFEPNQGDKEKKLQAIKLGKSRLQVPLSGNTKAGINTGID